MKSKMTKKVVIRYSPEQHQDIEEKAEKLGMNMSEFIREKSLSNSEVHSKDNICISKSEIGKWYVETLEAVNCIEDKGAFYSVSKKMEELECLLLK